MGKPSTTLQAQIVAFLATNLLQLQFCLVPATHPGFQLTQFLVMTKQQHSSVKEV